MPKPPSWFAALVVALLSSQAHALEVGQTAPAIDKPTWLVGNAPSAGTVMLIDLWEPGDPASRATMPCLTDLQHRHVNQVQVIGLTAAPADVAQSFISRMGSRIDYRLAQVADIRPWMPSGVGPPVTLLVDSHGTVVWWGDATQAARPLVELLDGTLVPMPAPLPAQTMVATPANTGTSSVK